MGCQDLNRVQRAAPRRGNPRRDVSAEQKKQVARLMGSLVWVIRARARVGGGEHPCGKGQTGTLYQQVDLSQISVPQLGTCV